MGLFLIFGHMVPERSAGSRGRGGMRHVGQTETQNKEWETNPCCQTVR